MPSIGEVPLTLYNCRPVNLASLQNMFQSYGSLSNKLNLQNLTTNHTNTVRHLKEKKIRFTQYHMNQIWERLIAICSALQIVAL